MVEGVSEVLKHFQTSKLASAALLITSVFLIVGPRHYSFVPTVPEAWQWLVWAIMLFTAAQCCWWATSASYKSICRAASKFYKFCFPVKIERLSEAELTVLGTAAANAGYFNPDKYYEREPIAISLAVTKLVRHKLMCHGMMGGAFLTDEGKKFCLMHLSASRQQ